MEPTLKVLSNEMKEADRQKQEEQRMITIAGGVDLTVFHLNGTSELVKVRQIPATKLENFMSRLADEATSISVYCDRPLEWADTLRHDSITEILSKGLEINNDFLGAWCQRRAKWTEMLNVGVIAELHQKLEALSSLLASVNSARQLPTSTDSLPKK